MWFSGYFFLLIFGLFTVKINHSNYRPLISLSVGKLTKSAGDQIIICHCVCVCVYISIDISFYRYRYIYGR